MGDHAGDKGYAQVDEDALGDLPHGDIHHHTLEPEQRRQNRDKDVAVDGKEQHLEDGVEGHQSGGILTVTTGQVVPDDDHGDAARHAHHDQADHVFGVVAKENQGKDKHQNRSHHPVLHQGEGQNFFISENHAHLIVLDLGQRRIHHQDQAYGNGDAWSSPPETC